MKLTLSNIAKIKRNAAGKSDHIEWDDELPGFGLRVRDGVCSWIVQYKIDSKQRRITLGPLDALSPDEARHGWETEGGLKKDGAAKILLSARDGTDYTVTRAARRQKAAHIVGGIISDYLEGAKSSMRPRSYEEKRRHLEVNWKSLHGLPIEGITRRDVAAGARVIAKHNGPVAANRSRASLSAFFTWAIGEGLCDQNPVVGTNKQDENGPRDRTLTDAEVAAILRALPDDNYGRIVRLLFFTGCRR